ncbi:hypothetical protein HMPREF0297_0906 [Corynebacterium jeikeium ATCC 43734]|nr:hypothetical protein HMPREF0297_0906 [Corynebacterium jeikeium ATCC 43734]
MDSTRGRRGLGLPGFVLLGLAGAAELLELLSGLLLVMPLIMAHLLVPAALVGFARC